jgi:hypothetical protein
MFSPSVPDDLPPELRFEADRPPPSGYRHAKIDSYTLEIVGGSIFLGSYLATVGIAAIDGFEDHQGWLAVPLAGPSIWWRRENPPSEGPTGGIYLQGMAPVLITIPQVTGLGLLMGGLLEPPDDRWVREDLSDDEISFRLTPVPIHSGFGLAGTGRF